MDLILCFEFDGIEADGFKILNPPTVPLQGEMVCFRWEDFVTDEEALKRLYEFNEDSIFLADILSRTYTAEYVKVLIILCTQESYDQWAAIRDQDTIRKRHGDRRKPL